MTALEAGGTLFWDGARGPLGLFLKLELFCYLSVQDSVHHITVKVIHVTSHRSSFLVPFFNSGCDLSGSVEDKVIGIVPGCNI